MRTKQEILESYYKKGRIYDEEEEMAFYLTALADFEVFFEYIIGHTVGEYHKKIFKLLKNKRLCMMAPRGHAKTEICSVCYVIWKALNSENKEIIIISSAEYQALRILRRIKTHIESNEFLRDLKPKYSSAYWSKSELVLTNGTRITSAPFTDTVRGSRIDLCICDDILKKDLSDQTKTVNNFVEIVEPAVDNPGSQLIVVGTPQSFFDLFHRLEDPGSGYVFQRFECCASIEGHKLNGPPLFPERGWTMEKLKARLNTMGLAAFLKEYMCRPIQPGDIIFDYETLVKPCINEYLEELHKGNKTYTYWLGVDVALSKERSADYSAYVIVEKRDGDEKLRVVRVERPPKGTYTNVQFDRIKELHRDFTFRNIMIENKGNSMTLVESLQRDMETCGTTKQFPTTHSEKERIILKLQKLMANRQIELYNNETLIEELSSIGIKHRIIAGKSTEKIESLTGKDDTVMALALAVEAATSAYGQVGASWV